MSFWVAGAVVVGSVAGGVMQADAAGKAQQAGQDAAGRNLALSESDKARSLALASPYVASGQSALYAMRSMTGLDPVETIDPFDMKSLDDGMGYDWDEGSGGTSGSGGSGMGDADGMMRFRVGDDVKKAPRLHDNISDSDNDNWNNFLTSGGFQKFNEEMGGSTSEEDINAWIDDNWDDPTVGRGAKEKHKKFFETSLASGIGKFDEWAEFNRKQTPEEMEASKSYDGGDYQWETDPGYAFRLAEGNKALEKKQQAGGSAYSGASMKGSIAYNQNFASNEYGNIFNRLSSIAGMGIQGVGLATNQGAQAASYGANTDYGNAGMAGAVAKGNAYSDAAAGIGSAVAGGMGQQKPMQETGFGGTTGSSATNVDYGNDWTNKYARENL